MALTPGQRSRRLRRSMALNAVQIAAGNSGGEPFLKDIVPFMTNPFEDDFEHFIAVGAIPMGIGWYADLGEDHPDSDELAVIWNKLCQAFGKPGATQPTFLDAEDDLSDFEMAIFAASTPKKEKN